MFFFCIIYHSLSLFSLCIALKSFLSLNFIATQSIQNIVTQCQFVDLRAKWSLDEYWWSHLSLQNMTVMFHHFKGKFIRHLRDVMFRYLSWVMSHNDDNNDNHIFSAYNCCPFLQQVYCRHRIHPLLKNAFVMYIIAMSTRRTSLYRDTPRGTPRMMQRLGCLYACQVMTF